MKRIAIVFATKHGQTRTIAQYLRRRFLRQGYAVDLLEIGKLSWHEPLGLGYQAVLVGAPVYRERIPTPLVRWVKRNRAILSTRESGFFTVSLNAADARKEARAADQRLLKKFTEEMQWRPRHLSSLAGALKYTQYGWPLRWILRHISREAGGPTDTSRDHELTDWANVDAFADNFLAAVKTPHVIVEGPSWLPPCSNARTHMGWDEILVG